MKHYTNSDYALNKFSGGIVYRFADGIVEITLADYLAENPGKTESDFLALKQLSDTIYRNQARDENTQTKKNLAYDAVDGAALCQGQSPEDLLISEIDALAEEEWYKKHLTAANRALDKLTAIQRRRFLMYHINGKTIREIANIEKAHFTTVHESLQAATRKINKALAKNETPLQSFQKNALGKRMD